MLTPLLEECDHLGVSLPSCQVYRRQSFRISHIGVSSMLEKQMADRTPIPDSHDR